MLKFLLWTFICLLVVYFGSAVIAGIYCGVKKGLNDIK